MTTATASDIRLVAHLVRRIAFGAPAWRLEALARRPYEELVEDFLSVERFPRPEEDLLERFMIEHADEESHAWAANRWVFRMINTQRPLEEKMALFWHNRFATGVSKVSNRRMMAEQIEMLRDTGMGCYRELLRKLSRDPAMIWWLDQQMNHNGDTNENYGRELLELFSMGRGHYTEDDVRSAARAFSGWTIDQTIPRYPNGWYDTNFVYRDDDHDHGLKTFLGETGKFNGDDIIEIVLKQPATAWFIGENLYRFFVSDTPDEDAIDVLAGTLVQCGFEIRPVLRTLFNSDWFKESAFQRVRWPVELVVGTIQLTGQHRDAYEFGLKSLPEASALMGQEILNPPTVEGWHTGHEWIDSSYLIQRVNFAADRLGNVEAPGIARIIERVAGERRSVSPEDLLDSCLYEMGCIELQDRTRETVLGQLGDREIRTDDAFPGRVAYLMKVIGASREYQMG